MMRRPYSIFHKIHFPWFNPHKFISQCRKIESDPNFQPKISNTELLRLVSNEDGTDKHHPRKHAITIQPSKLSPINQEGDTIGMTYQINIAQFGLQNDNDLKECWHIYSMIVLVTKKGDVSLHDLEYAKNNNYKLPHVNSRIDDYLGWKCLHLPTSRDLFAGSKNRSLNF